MPPREGITRRGFLLQGVALPAILNHPEIPSGSRRPLHPVWQKLELALQARRRYANPYTDATVWVDLEGPGFHRRVYGFWDGGSTFRVRLLATAPGLWRWRSGSRPHDPGLAGQRGSFQARAWTPDELAANPLRRGYPRATANHHALEHPDGTPFFAIGDTWWAAGTHCFPWHDGDRPRPIGPQAGFKDYVRFRKAQGYNWINMIASFPNWETDGLPWNLVMDDAAHTTVRSAWLQFGTDSAKNMSNEGGQPFFFPGKVPGYANVFPDINRINPAYFQAIDRKLDWLNQQGFMIFLEAARRDVSQCWKKYYEWPGSYARYIQYIWSRYQANHTVLSPIHLDIIQQSVSPADFQQAIDLVFKTWGHPPFGNLLSTNCNPSTLVNWGENSWVTLHQIGNRREHEYYWYLSEIYRDPHPRPALNGEPYYAGYHDARGIPGGYKYGAQGGTPRDDRYVRSAMYGSALSGGLAGHVYGAEGIWGADVEPQAPVKMWTAFQWRSGAQMRYLRDFLFSLGRAYQQLVPDSWVVPSRTALLKGYNGWAYAARTPDQRNFMVYFEKGCPAGRVRGALPGARYQARWFNPRRGVWRPPAVLKASNIGVIQLPPFPSRLDWALRLSIVS